jgi:hypothetical protein
MRVPLVPLISKPLVSVCADDLHQQRAMVVAMTLVWMMK